MSNGVVDDSSWLGASDTLPTNFGKCESGAKFLDRVNRVNDSFIKKLKADESIKNTVVVEFIDPEIDAVFVIDKSEILFSPIIDEANSVFDTGVVPMYFEKAKKLSSKISGKKYSEILNAILADNRLYSLNPGEGYSFFVGKLELFVGVLDNDKSKVRVEKIVDFSSKNVIEVIKDRDKELLSDRRLLDERYSPILAWKRRDSEFLIVIVILFLITLISFFNFFLKAFSSDDNLNFNIYLVTTTISFLVLFLDIARWQVKIFKGSDVPISVFNRISLSFLEADLKVGFNKLRTEDVLHTVLVVDRGYSETIAADVGRKLKEYKESILEDINVQLVFDEYTYTKFFYLNK